MIVRPDFRLVKPWGKSAYCPMGAPALRQEIRGFQQGVSFRHWGIGPHWETFTPPAKLIEPDYNTLPPLPMAQFTPPASLIPRAECFQAYGMIIATDSEWEVVEPEGGLDYNDILSYQFTALLNLGNGRWTGAEGVIETDAAYTRLKLTDILSDAFKAFGVGRVRGEGMRVLHIAHMGKAEWSAWADRDEYNNVFSFARECPILVKPHELTLRDQGRHPFKVNLEMRDSYLLAPDRQSGLAAISAYTHHKKLKLAPGVIERMKTLRKEDNQLFRAYGINDCRVSLEYVLKIVSTLQDVLKTKALPVTLGNASVNAYRQFIAEQTTLEWHDIFGTEEREYFDSLGRERIDKKALRDERAFSKSFVSNSFIGAMNIAFWKGPFSREGWDIFDLDFGGAYPAAMAMLPVIDWSDHPMEIRDLKLLERDLGEFSQIAFLHVDFEFPAGTTYPCLPVRGKTGPVFPLRGSSVATGPEVVLALELNADIRVRKAAFFARTSAPIMADYMTMLAKAREKTAKGSLENMLLKEMMNSTYGKMAQAIKERYMFNYTEDPSGERRRLLKPSPITCEEYASMITGTVRAALGSMVNVLAAMGGAVLSATTDGCMVALPRRCEPALKLERDASGNTHWVAYLPKPFHEVYPEIYDALLTYPAIQALARGRGRMGLKPDTWLEVKHVGDRAITAKTRGYVLYYGEHCQYLARAGIMIDSDDEFMKIYTAESIEERDVKHLASAKDIMLGKQRDLVMITGRRKTNLGWDYKRRPLAEVGPTVPWDSVEVGKVWRKEHDKRRKRGRNPTVAEVSAARIDMVELSMSPRAIKRVVAIAIRQNWLDCRPPGFTVEEMAGFLGVRLETYKQYGRKEVVPNSIVMTEEHRAIVDSILDAIPDLDTIYRVRVYEGVFSAIG